MAIASAREPRRGRLCRVGRVGSLDASLPGDAVGMHYDEQVEEAPAIFPPHGQRVTLHLGAAPFLHGEDHEDPVGRITTIADALDSRLEDAAFFARNGDDHHVAYIVP